MPGEGFVKVSERKSSGTFSSGMVDSSCFPNVMKGKDTANAERVSNRGKRRIVIDVGVRPEV
jgi:hypothetical protein